MNSVYRVAAFIMLKLVAPTLALAACLIGILLVIPLVIWASTLI